MGVAGNASRPRGYGKTDPRAVRDMKVHRQLNQRIEIVLSIGGESIPKRQYQGSP
jgi:flagellar motor protein MotB